MAKFNPDFWEVTLAAESWDRLAREDALWYESGQDSEARARFCERAEELWPRIRELIDEVLTERQREVVLLYYLEELNQRQIAERLGLSQQSVSEHLYGKAQKDRRVGGALRKLRKACAKRGIRWE
jgi:RNA polymerase sigma factor (sigma-70 family)